MIGSTNAGTGGGGTYSNSDFAFLLVTYPQGASVSITDNGAEPTVITDDEGIGVCIFGIPNAGTWTLNAAQGDETSTQNIEFTAADAGTVKNASISFSANLVELGSPKVTFSTSGKASATEQDGYYNVTAGGRQGVNPYSYNVEGTVYTTNPVATEGYTKVVVEGELPGKKMAIWNASDASWTEDSADATLTLSSSLGGTGELAIPAGLTSVRIGFVGTGAGNVIKVRNLYLSN